jgi:hypothetical protein
VYRPAEGSPVAANTIEIEEVAFLTAGDLMSYARRFSIYIVPVPRTKLASCALTGLLPYGSARPPEDLITLAHRPDDGYGQREKTKNRMEPPFTSS